MSVEILKNGSRHDSYPVDDVLRNIESLVSDGRGGKIALVDLHRIVTGHPKADRISPDNKKMLIESELMQPDGTVSQLVKDVVQSATTGQDMSLAFTGNPYQNESTASQKAGLDSEEPLAGLLDSLSLISKQGGLKK